MLKNYFSKLMLVPLLIAVLLFGTAAPSPAGGKLKPGEAWVLHMSSNFLGNVTFNLSDNTTSVFMEKLGLEAFGDEKMTQILICNHRDKTYLQESRAQWQKRAAKYKSKNKKTTNYKGYKVSKSKPAKVCGLNCSFFEVNPIRLDGTVEPVDDKRQIWVTQELETGKGVAKQFAMEILRVFAQLEETPTTSGVLLRLKANKSRKLVTMLDTYKIEKVKKGLELKIPKGYRRVKDEVALLWGDDSTNGDMFGSP
ncbi:MAG: hypothetical protein K2Y39_08775 [Candidatus Obscuribacterales bacterium]|nr:hypothetical protein [Candidatus Obscuribacterales bacterium]